MAPLAKETKTVLPNVLTTPGLNYSTEGVPATLEAFGFGGQSLGKDTSSSNNAAISSTPILSTSSISNHPGQTV
jgi:hypothetical protein